MSFHLTNRAQADMINIYVDGVGQFGITMAERYHEGLLALFSLLSDNPHMDRLRPEFSPPVRMHVYRSHLVIYVEDEQDVLIVRVLHGRQDWQSALA